MDQESDRQDDRAVPSPEPRYEYSGIHGATLYYADYEPAVRYYTDVLGSPAYVEGAGTRSWRVGDTWLTLLRGKSGNPKNVEVMFAMRTPEEAERLHRAFITSGGKGEEPSDQIMHVPVRFCPVTDPFGTELLIMCPLEKT